MYIFHLSTLGPKLTQLCFLCSVHTFDIMFKANESNFILTNHLYFDVNTIYEIFMYRRRVLCKLYMELLISKLFCRKVLMDAGGGGGR
jgi:hypothetical protein